MYKHIIICYDCNTVCINYLCILYHIFCVIFLHINLLRIKQYFGFVEI